MGWSFHQPHPAQIASPPPHASACNLLPTVMWVMQRGVRPYSECYGAHFSGHVGYEGRGTEELCCVECALVTF